jgi:hypothetical protein
MKWKKISAVLVILDFSFFVNKSIQQGICKYSELIVLLQATTDQLSKGMRG